jgi:hypothetical protein
MGVAGIWLLSMGVGDLVAALSGRPARNVRAVLGWLAAIATCAVVSLTSGLGAGATVLLTGITAVSAGAWIRWRIPAMTPGRATAVAWGFVMTLALLVASGPAWPTPAGGSLERWLASSAVPAIADAGNERALVIAGVFAFLLATCNGLVRLILAAVGTDTESGEQKLRGGRIIGPLERCLLFGFGLAGQPTAAALVASAKSLLRFPEISSARGFGIDLVTEYFLVGSLTSWTLALAPLAFVPR